MGASLTYLSRPVTTREIESFEFPGKARGAAGGIQGWRRGMEDAHCIFRDQTGKSDSPKKISVSPKSGSSPSKGKIPRDLAVFGVFDGHGGPAVANWVAGRIPSLLPTLTSYESGEYGKSLHDLFMALDDEMVSSQEALDAIKELGKKKQEHENDKMILDLPTLLAFCGAEDETPNLWLKPNINPELNLADVKSLSELFDGPLLDEFAEIPRTGREPRRFAISSKRVFEVLDSEQTPFGQGCTAVVCLIDFLNAKIYCANSGDSRAVLSRGGAAAALSVDHKPSQALERRRVLNAGGSIEGKGEYARVEGDLNLSRALGDHRYKLNKTLPAELQIISARPDIRERSLCKYDEVLVMACDGIWETWTNQAAIDYVRGCLSDSEDLLKQLATSNDIEQTIDESFDQCIQKDLQRDSPYADFTGCDNMTLLIVQLDPEWLKNLPESVDESLGASFPPITFGAPVPAKTKKSRKEPKPKKQRPEHQTSSETENSA